MSEVKRIIDQLERSFKGEAWHGPSVLEVLSGVSVENASSRPIEAAHTIWEITLHIRAWLYHVCKRLEGEPFEPTTEQDWPPASATENAWQQTQQDLNDVYEKLQKKVSELSDEDLEVKDVPGKPYTLYFMIHGVIQHNLFHAGQIAVLKKA